MIYFELEKDMGVIEAVERAVKRVEQMASRVGGSIPDTQLVDFKDSNWPKQVADIAAVRRVSEEAVKSEKA